MAHVTPPLQSIRPVSAGEHTELELLRRLAEGLPDAYALFHSVDWTQADPGGDRFGELDIAVVNAAGDIAILEIKAGGLEVHAGALFKRYGNAVKSVSHQTTRQHGAILHRLRSDGLEVRLQLFLVMPHQRADAIGTVAYPRERILDAQDCEDLCGAIERKLGRGLNLPELRERVLAFLGNRLAVTTDLASIDQRVREVTRSIAGGLADWVPRITAPHGVIRVTATAGSGKTQLALRLLREARAQSQRAAYVCFNRPLADHVRELLPTGVGVSSFHQLCWEHGGRPTAPTDFEALAAAFCTAPDAKAALDLLVIDEVQDLRLAWVQALLERVAPAGRLVLLDDPAQCLYDDREELEIPEAVVVTSAENFRSPRRIVDVINALALTDMPVVARGVHQGELPGMRTWDTVSGPFEATSAAVQSCLDLGFQLADIAIITWRGRDTSALRDGVLGRWSLSRFSGNYDAHGNPLWTDGLLRFETLRRIKGQSAAAVVFTEIDFNSLDGAMRRMLFVGMTRARMHLELVLSTSAEVALASALSQS